MISPQTKSLEVIQYLSASIEAGESLLDDFTLRRLLKDVEAIPELVEKLSLKGLIYILQGKVSEGMELCERSISMAPSVSPSWTNYLSLLSSGVYLSRYNEVIDLAMKNINSCPVLLRQIINHASFTANLDLLNHATGLVNKLRVEPLNVFETCDMQTFTLLKQNETKAHRLSLLVHELMFIVESRKLKIIRSKVSVDNDGILGYHCILSTNDIGFICSFNDELFDRIFDKNIDTTDCFAIFEGNDEI
ncbi:conserved hypothetical protein [Xenorhabdus bovienii str. oregonense]|uniref:Uncharacterized protein n=1 Tax=Xenorhabdus bovienii str. oregonense TaxID=1398202 RepID=A0A077P3J1_XENBV|nr:hypothetical protein [Xenorhabdus bovienii]CDH04431.1 conserved hypothetical protein [Xenorhabdus bovienii str. oregonense]